MPVLRRCLGALADDAQHVLVVCDEAGRILWLEGHERVKEDAVERIRFSEGMLWTEDSVGTNAIGTALEIDHAVQVFSAEHFLAEQHGWWCSAAPIHDPVDRARCWASSTSPARCAPRIRTASGSSARRRGWRRTRCACAAPPTRSGCARPTWSARRCSAATAARWSIATGAC